MCSHTLRLRQCAALVEDCSTYHLLRRRYALAIAEDLRQERRQTRSCWAGHGREVSLRAFLFKTFQTYCCWLLLAFKKLRHGMTCLRVGSFLLLEVSYDMRIDLLHYNPFLILQSDDFN